MNTSTITDLSRFRTLRGRLTRYALACGYIEQHDTNPANVREGQRVTLWQEHGALHVRAHDFTTGQRLFWDCPATLKAARKRFDAAKRAMQAASKGGAK